MSTHEVNCRNFKCPNSKDGDCLSARLEFVPVGGLIDRLICIQCSEPEDKPAKQEESEPVEERTEPEPIPDQ